MKRLLAVLAVAVLAAPAMAQTHYSLGSDWVTGHGVYVVVPDGADNYVLVATALNNADPKHAWVVGDFPDAYTVRCDVRMDSWADGQDLSRAGIALHIQPDGTAPDGSGDRGINLLLHDSFGQVQFLNDLRGWGPAEEFDWTTGVWYTFEISSDGTTVTGSLTERANPENSMELEPWNFPDPQNRQGGFPGITPSTLGGLQASFDNFVVMDLDGNVLFEDDFNSPGPEVSTAQGLRPAWVAGEAGLYVAQGGVLYSIATTAVDPKHAFVGIDLVGGGSIKADVNVMSWQDNQDLSRGGIALHIQPDGTAPDGRGDRGINLLFHDNLSQVQFLNDLRGWGPAHTFAFTPRTWYTVEMSSNGTTVTGSITNRANPADHVVLDAWNFPDPQNRADGFAGVTASTLRGLVVAYDNIEIRNASGVLVFQDDFQSFGDGSSSVEADWEIYR